MSTSELASDCKKTARKEVTNVFESIKNIVNKHSLSAKEIMHGVSQELSKLNSKKKTDKKNLTRRYIMTPNIRFEQGGPISKTIDKTLKAAESNTQYASLMNGTYETEVLDRFSKLFEEKFKICKGLNSADVLIALYCVAVHGKGEDTKEATTPVMYMTILKEIFKARPHKWRQKRAEEATRVKKQKKTGKHLFSLHRANRNQTERPKRLSAR